MTSEEASTDLDDAARITRSPLRIGLYHGPLFHNGREYETYGPYRRYAKEFTRHFEKVIVIAPVFRTADSAHNDFEYRGCVLDTDRIDVIELPPFSTYVQSFRHMRCIRRRLREAASRVDIVNCRNTAPGNTYFEKHCRKFGVTFFYHFTSDPWSILRWGDRYRGMKGMIARILWGIGSFAQARAMRRSYSFVNGTEFCNGLRRCTDRVEPLISSTLTDDDFRLRESFTLHDPARLLYVGYLKHMKGLPDLLNAISILQSRGRHVTLDLVGDGPLRTELKQQAKQLRIDQTVRFHGYVAMGDELFQWYDSSDIFVFPSLSEGSPRVVLEAMARSLPVISTPVGSVPETITNAHSGILVSMHDSNALAAAVCRFLDDEPLRANCARNALGRVRKLTVESYVASIANKSKALYETARKTS